MEYWSEVEPEEVFRPADAWNGRQFDDIYFTEDMFSNHGVEVRECELSPDTRVTGEDDTDNQRNTADFERFFSMEYPNRRVPVTFHSTNAHRFLSELLDIDVYRYNIPMKPFGHVGILENGPELKESTKQLKQEALANLKFTLLTKSYKLTTDLVEQVVDRHTAELADKLRSTNPERIRETTTNLLFSIICDTYEENLPLQKDIEAAESQFHERIFVQRDDSSSQNEYECSVQQKVEDMTFGNIARQNAEDAMETFYQYFQTIEDKKTLKEFMSNNFLGSNDLTIHKVILKESENIDVDLSRRRLIICGFLKNTLNPNGSKQRTLLFLLAKVQKYRSMTCQLEVSCDEDERGDYDSNGERQFEPGWKFIMNIRILTGNTSSQQPNSVSSVSLFYTRRKKRLKKNN